MSLSLLSLSHHVLNIISNHQSRIKGRVGRFAHAVDFSQNKQVHIDKSLISQSLNPSSNRFVTINNNNNNNSSNVVNPSESTFDANNNDNNNSNSNTTFTINNNNDTKSASMLISNSEGNISLSEREKEEIEKQKELDGFRSIITSTLSVIDEYNSSIADIG